MLQAVLNAYAPSIAVSTCTDGRTDGQDVEPPCHRDYLQVVIACETSEEISS